MLFIRVKSRRRRELRPNSSGRGDEFTRMNPVQPVNLVSRFELVPEIPNECRTAACGRNDEPQYTN